MRRLSPLVLSIALALTGAGCASSPESLSGAGTSGGGGGGGSGGGSGGGTGGGGGGGGGGSLGAGDTSIVVTGSGRSPSSGGVSQLRINNAGADNELATVIVDPRNGSGSTRQAQMNVYLRESELGAQYTEYRTTTSTTDDELQLWQYGSSYAAQYRDVKSGLSSWFFNGTRTAAPTGSATYAGQYTAGMKTSNFITPDAAPYEANGEWRLAGTTNLNANFDTGQFNGTLSAPTYWERFDSDGTVVSGPAGSGIYSFQNTGYTLRGTVDGNRISGTTCYGACGLGGASNANNQMFGGVFGPNAEEITGVFGTLATVAQPTGGDTAINDDRRAYIDTQGMFHGQRP